MATVALVNPQLSVNNNTQRYLEGTLEYNEGFGEVNTRVHTAGPGDREKVTTRDVNTQFGMVKFSVISTEDVVNTIREWLNNDDANVITLSQGGFNRTFTGAQITNNPNNAIGNDAVIEVEFTSNPAS